MNKLYKVFLVTLILGFSLVSNAQYDAGDTTVINTIKNTNFSVSTTLNWTDSDPGNWIGVVWDTTVTPHRIVELHLADATSTNEGRTHDSLDHAGIWCGSIDPLVYPTADANGLHWISTGVETDLTGVLDLTGLSELRIIVLNRNELLTEIKVSGLQKLEYLQVGNTGVSALDASNLPALLLLKVPMNRYELEAGSGQRSHLKLVDASNCPNLVRFKASWDVDSLESVNVSNCTSLVKLSIKQASLKSLNMSGVTTLYKMSLGNSRNATDPLGSSILSNIYANTELRALGLGNAGVFETLDVSSFDSLRKTGFKADGIESTNGFFALQDLRYLNGEDNRLNLTEAVELANNTSAGTGYSMSPQQNDGFTLLYTDSVDFSVHDSIMVDTLLEGSTYNLYAADGTLITGPVASGVFTFLASDTGFYYVTMSNSGITVTTDTIEVVAAAPRLITTIDVANFGNVNIGESKVQVLTLTNDGNASLDVSNITVPAGYSISGTTSTLAPAATDNFNVTFSPSVAQIYSGTIQVTAAGIQQGSIDQVSVTGTGIDATGITKETTELITFYPNPTRDQMFIKNNKGNFEVLNLYNLEGQLIRSVKMNGTVAIDFRDLTNGVYFIRSIDGKINQKVVKH